MPSKTQPPGGYSVLIILHQVYDISHKSWCKISFDCNWTRTQNHLVLKQTLNHLAKLTKWLSCVLSTYLYNAFDCIFLSCHICDSEWIHTLIVAWMSRNSLFKSWNYLLKYDSWKLQLESKNTNHKSLNRTLNRSSSEKCLM